MEINLKLEFTPKKLALIAQFFFAFLAFWFFFLPAVNFNFFGSNTISGYEAWLGANGGYVSFFGVLTYIFVIALFLLPAVRYFVKFDAKTDRLLSLITIGVCFVSMLCFFLGSTRLMLNVSSDAVKYFSLGAGAIINAIFMIIIAGLSAAYQYLLKD